MSKEKLAIRIYDIANQYCHEDVVDNNGTPSDVLIDILQSPDTVMEFLCEIIERVGDR